MTLIRPVVSYSAKSWTLDKEDRIVYECLRERLSDAYTVQYVSLIHGELDKILKLTKYCEEKI